MKTLYSNVLKTLVTDSTITQTQSDKVLVSATENTQGGTRPEDTAKDGGAKPKNDR
jgi:hypothetical protein